MDHHVDTTQFAPLSTNYGPFHLAAAQLLQGFDVRLTVEQHHAQRAATIAIYVRDQLWHVVVARFGENPLSWGRQLEDALYSLLRICADFPTDELKRELAEYSRRTALPTADPAARQEQETAHA